MSGVEWTCEHCGQHNLIMCGSPPFCGCPEGQREFDAEMQESARRTMAPNKPGKAKTLDEAMKELYLEPIRKLIEETW